MGFVADNLGTKNNTSKWFSRKKHSKVVEDQLVFLAFARQ